MPKARKRAPEVESAFKACIDSLTDKSSPHFRGVPTCTISGGAGGYDLRGHDHSRHVRELVSTGIRRNSGLGYGRWLAASTPIYNLVFNTAW